MALSLSPTILCNGSWFLADVDQTDFDNKASNHALRRCSRPKAETELRCHPRMCGDWLAHITRVRLKRISGADSWSWAASWVRCDVLMVLDTFKRHHADKGGGLWQRTPFGFIVRLGFVKVHYLAEVCTPAVLNRM
jgi:hypothetical protein